MQMLTTARFAAVFLRCVCLLRQVAFHLQQTLLYHYICVCTFNISPLSKTGLLGLMVGSLEVKNTRYHPDRRPACRRNRRRKTRDAVLAHLVFLQLRRVVVRPQLRHQLGSVLHSNRKNHKETKKQNHEERLVEGDKAAAVPL